MKKALKEAKKKNSKSGEVMNFDSFEDFQEMLKIARENTGEVEDEDDP